MTRRRNACGATSKSDSRPGCRSSTRAISGIRPSNTTISLVEYADRFHPHFVVVSVFINDFASEESEVALKGKGDWEEGEYWLGKIIELCRSRGWTYLVVPAPYEPVLLGKRKAGHYPGELSNVLHESSLTFLDPSDDLLERPSRAGRRRRTNRQEALCVPALQLPSSKTATSRRLARKPGPRPWAGGSRSCSRAIQAVRRGSTDGMIPLRSTHAWFSLARRRPMRQGVFGFVDQREAARANI